MPNVSVRATYSEKIAKKKKERSVGKQRTGSYQHEHTQEKRKSESNSRVKKSKTLQYKNSRLPYCKSAKTLRVKPEKIIELRVH